MNRWDVRRLINWYQQNKRDLPWRRSRDPYRIWVSEIMLQQTRVAAVIPFYERFLERFPDLTTLAVAPEKELLAAWAGLGYYSRVRNMQRAAQQMNGVFPASYSAIRELAGIGEYTAAAIASIAFGQRHAAVDGNVLRVIARVTGESGDISNQQTRRRMGDFIAPLVPVRDPGLFNQAMMEVGATVCLPRGAPACGICPLSLCCVAKREHRQHELPIKSRPGRVFHVERTLVYAERDGRILLFRYPDNAPKLAGFWELPDATALVITSPTLLGSFRHSITNTQYVVRVVEANVRSTTPAGYQWLDPASAAPLSTVARKALALLTSRSR